MGTGSFSVLIIESSDPEDFYDELLDGVAAQSLLKVLGIKNWLKITLNKEHLKKALRHAKEHKPHVIHLSCHGRADNKGIVLANDDQIEWPKFAELFCEAKFAPQALVMSSCGGAAKGIDQAFAAIHKRPGIIFGSRDDHGYGEYAVAWALLYQRFKLKGLTVDSARTALRQINAVVSDAFLYRRWDSQKEKYLYYPGKQVKYAVKEVSNAGAPRW